MDVDGALDIGEDGGGLILVARGIPSPIFVVAHRECNGERLNFRRFCIQADENERFQ